MFSHRIQNSFLKDSTLFAAIVGDAAKMGHVVGTPAALIKPVMQGGFKADLGAMLKVIPEGISGPNAVLKKFIR
jgi:hypothetical protein